VPQERVEITVQRVGAEQATAGAAQHQRNAVLLGQLVQHGGIYGAQAAGNALIALVWRARRGWLPNYARHGRGLR
jgi:hypothetical protein